MKRQKNGKDQGEVVMWGWSFTDVKALNPPLVIPSRGERYWVRFSLEQAMVMPTRSLDISLQPEEEFPYGNLMQSGLLAPTCSDETGFPGHQDNEGQACSDDKGDQDPPSPIPPVPSQRPQDKDATTSQGTASFLRWAATPLRILSLDLPRILSPSGAYSFLLVLVGC